MFRMTMKKKINNPVLWIAVSVLMAAAVLFSTNLWCEEGYNALGRRDPFVPLVGVGETGSRSGLEGIMSIDDISLTGIVSDSEGTRSIIVNGEILNEGQRVERVFVESIGDNEVVILIDEERHTLRLYE